jgi:acyl carrier protein
MEDKVLEIVASILNVEKSELSLESSPETLSNWDSMNHMNIIMALEEEFDITFTEIEIMDMLSVRSLLDKLNSNI